VAQQTLIGSLLLFGLMTVVVVLVRTSINNALSHSDCSKAKRPPDRAPIRTARSGDRAARGPWPHPGDQPHDDARLESIDAQKPLIAAAHQLRTPIAGLRLQAQLAEDEPSTAESRARMQAIDASAARAAHVIEQLLTLSVSEAGAMPSHFTPVDLVDVAADVIQHHLPAAASRSIDLGLRPRRAAMVTGNATLRRADGNLVDNAVRYGRHCGT
jgi:hypothetical protein